MKKIKYIGKSIKVQELTDEDIVLIDKFNLTYNPFSGALEEGW